METEPGLEEMCEAVLEALTACQRAVQAAQEEDHATFAHLVFVLGSLDRRLSTLRREAMLHWLCQNPELRQELSERLARREGRDAVGPNLFQLPSSTRGGGDTHDERSGHLADIGNLRELRPSQSN